MNKTCDILIRNATVLTREITVKESHSIAIQDGRIVWIGPTGEKVYDGLTIIDAKDKLAMPGLVDCHVHACQYLLRGKLADEYPMVWTRILVPFESALNEEDCYLSGQLTYLQQIKSGITLSVESGGNHMHAVAQAAVESGIRAVITRSTMDQGPVTSTAWESPQENIRNTEKLYKDYNNQGDGRISVWFGMRQIMSCSLELLKLLAEAAVEYNTGIHAHLSEHKDEISYCLQNYKKRPVEVLDQFGLLSRKLLAAHNVMLSEKDIDLLKEHQVNLVHCPRANLGNHGIPKTPALLHAGLSIGIGSDGASGCNMDLFEEIRLLRFALQATQGLPIFDPVLIPISEYIKMLTIYGTEGVGMENELGSLEVGKKADLILINLAQPHITPNLNLIHVIVEGMRAGDVTDCIIDGKVIMQNREVKTMDEEKIMTEGKKRIVSVYRRAGLA